MHYEQVVLGGVSSWDLRNFDDFSNDPNFTDHLASIRVPQKKTWEIFDAWFPPEAGRYKVAAVTTYLTPLPLPTSWCLEVKWFLCFFIQISTTDLIVLWMIVLFCALHLCKECFQFIQNVRKFYLHRLVHVLRWTLDRVDKMTVNLS